MNDILKQRMDAHRAACADLDSDPLIQAVFTKPAPIAPLASPMKAGAMLRRQAE
jgi:hypothetical protein